MGDGDDDQQVKSHGEQRHGREQDIDQHGLGLRVSGLPAGVVELWVAEIGSFPLGLHHPRGEAFCSEQNSAVVLFYHIRPGSSSMWTLTISPP